MLGEIALGTLASLIANGLQGMANIIGKEGFTDHINNILELAKKDFHKEYPNVDCFNNFLARQENIDILYDWIINDNINSQRPSLNEMNYDESMANEDQINYFFKRILYHIKQDEELRSYAMFEMIRDINKKIIDLDFIKNNELYSRIFIDELGIIDSLFNQYFKHDIWKYKTNLDHTNYIFANQANSLNYCLMNLNVLIQNLDMAFFNTVSNKNHENEMESFVYLLKISFQDKSTKVSYSYNKVIKYIAKLCEYCSIKSPEYFNALGQLQIDYGYEDYFIYIKVMSEFIAFNEEVIELLRNGISYKSSEEGDLKTLESMHEYLYHDIKLNLEPNIKKYIKVIYDKDFIIDVELAQMFAVDIKELRKELYPLTKSFLEYRYNNNISTRLSIKHYYRSTFQKYYSEIFDEVVIK